MKSERPARTPREKLLKNFSANSAYSAIECFRIFCCLRRNHHTQATMPYRGELMSRSRRQFLMQASTGLLGAAAVGAAAQTTEPPPGTPPAFGTGPQVGPEVSPATFTEAEKLVQIELTESEREVAARSWRSNMAALYERRTGPRKISLEPTLAPALRWDPLLMRQKNGLECDRFVRSKSDPG